MRFTISRAAVPLAVGLAAVQGPAAAAGVGPSASISADHQDYTRGLGTRTMLSAAARIPLKPGFVVQLQASRGERAVGGVALHGTGFGATLQTPLGKGLTSRTLLTRGKVGPLFAARSAGQEFAFKLGSIELRAGPRLTRYGGGLDVRSGHAGLTREAGPVRVDYALAAYAREGTLGGGLIHRFDGSLKDMAGSTHLMLAAGSSLHEHDYRVDKIPGIFRFAGLKRKQALGRGLSLELTGGWTAFSRPRGNYGAARIGTALTFTR